MAKKKKASHKYDVRSYFEENGRIENFGVSTNSYEGALKVYHGFLKSGEGFTVWKENAI